MMENLDNLIDNDKLENHKADYSFSHGTNFRTPARIISGAGLPLFLYIFAMTVYELNVVGILIALVFIFILLFVLTSTTGAQLCKRTGYLREYSSFVGIKWGKWKSSRNLTDVAILTIRKRQKSSSLLSPNNTSIESVETGVYFLIPTHRKRVLIKVCKNKNEAEEWAVKLAEEINKKYTTFAPKISEASKARRYR